MQHTVKIKLLLMVNSLLLAGETDTGNIYISQDRSNIHFPTNAPLRLPAIC